MHYQEFFAVTLYKKPLFVSNSLYECKEQAKQISFDFQGDIEIEVYFLESFGNEILMAAFRNGEEILV